MYPKTMGGLGEAYVAGLPFFRNAAAGDLFFAALMFGVGALVAAHSPGRERTTA
jgi:hypothetical protein